jgi:putative tryptophan/tyrosine transport system substrate-binding protein
MDNTIQRRDFITLLGGSTAAWPLAARAQQQAMPVIGFLHPATAAGYAPYVAAFREGLRERGFVEGRNVTIDFRWGEDDYTRLPGLAAQLVARRVAVIVGSGASAVVAKAASTSIPIVFSTGVDPIELGLVASFNRPGGNVTGTVQFNVDLLSKRLEILHEMVPRAGVIGLLINPASQSDSNNAYASALLNAARRLGQPVRILDTANAGQFEAAFATMQREGIGALLVSNNPAFTNGRAELVALAARYGIPASYEYREFVTAGGLMSYGSSNRDSYRLVGSYAGRILMGEKAADLPVVQPTRFEFVLNLKSAKALGLDIPLKLHAFADEVIE